MRKWRRRLGKAMADVLDLPRDVTMEMPRITMIGQVQIYVENHRGVLLFHDQELRLLLTKGQLLIQGKELVIQTILPEEVLVAGEISQVRFVDE